MCLKLVCDWGWEVGVTDGQLCGKVASEKIKPNIIPKSHAPSSFTQIKIKISSVLVHNFFSFSFHGSSCEPCLYVATIYSRLPNTRRR